MSLVLNFHQVMGSRCFAVTSQNKRDDTVHGFYFAWFRSEMKFYFTLIIPCLVCLWMAPNFGISIDISLETIKALYTQQSFLATSFQHVLFVFYSFKIHCKFVTFLGKVSDLRKENQALLDKCKSLQTQAGLIKSSESCFVASTKEEEKVKSFESNQVKNKKEKMLKVESKPTKENLSCKNEQMCFIASNQENRPIEKDESTHQNPCCEDTLFTASSNLWDIFTTTLNSEKFKTMNKGRSKYVTFYVGSLSYRATSYNVRRVFEKTLQIKIDEVVIARSSDGVSRGCGFVTVRWNELDDALFTQILLKKYSHEFKNNEKWYDVLTTIMSRKSICGRDIQVELARNQRKN